jgi:hypothetical protein
MVATLGAAAFLILEADQWVSLYSNLSLNSTARCFERLDCSGTSILGLKNTFIRHKAEIEQMVKQYYVLTYVSKLREIDCNI